MEKGTVRRGGAGMYWAVMGGVLVIGMWLAAPVEAAGAGAAPGMPSPDPEPPLAAPPQPAGHEVQLKLADLSFKVAELEKEMKRIRQDAKGDAEKKLTPVYVLYAFLLAGGIVSVIQLRRWAVKKTKSMIQEAMYRIDPTYLTIRIPASGFDVESTRLKWLGFKNLKTYPVLSPSDCMTDCVVVKVENDDEWQTFLKFLQEEKPDVSKVAYVVYTKVRVELELIANSENVIISNMPATLGPAVFSIARGLLCQRG